MGVVVDLGNHLVQLALDRGTVHIGVRVVRRVESLLLEGLQDLDGALHGALGGVHQCPGVLCVLQVLVEAADLHAHPLADGVGGGVVPGGVQVHTG